jgi:hypothetical protein
MLGMNNAECCQLSQRIELANELDKANHEGNWHWMLKHLSYSLHGSLLSADASLDVIPYFEQTLVQLNVVDFISVSKYKTEPGGLFWIRNSKTSNLKLINQKFRTVRVNAVKAAKA